MMLQPSTPVKKEKTLQPRYNPPQAKTLQLSASVKNAKTLQPPKTANVTDTKNVSKPSQKGNDKEYRGRGFKVFYG